MNLVSESEDTIDTGNLKVVTYIYKLLVVMYFKKLYRRQPSNKNFTNYFVKLEQVFAGDSKQVFSSSSKYFLEGETQF